MDVATWLEALGLGQYAPAFVENDIDLALLSSVISVWPGFGDEPRRQVYGVAEHRVILAFAAA
jgi:hypothetical protein